MVEGARRLLGEQGRGTILFLDEVHRFNRSQQDALLPSVEEGLLVLIGATTENPFFEVNAPLLSRSTLWRLEPLSLRGAGRGGGPGPGRRGRIGRARRGGRPGRPGRRRRPGRAHHPGGGPGPGRADRPVTLDDVERARHSRLHHYGEDDHYDQVSAFIKSVRGSDPDAGLYWLARMLESGEDARFIARRLVILASEDVGEADPLALVVADAAARAVEFVGLPEAQLNLAQAVVHLACAPKSNRVTVALGRARQDVREGPGATCPPTCATPTTGVRRPSATARATSTPTTDPGGWVDQQYRPDELEGRRYYEPSDRGHEAAVARPTRRRRRAIGTAGADGPAAASRVTKRTPAGSGQTVGHGQTARPGPAGP